MSRSYKKTPGYVHKDKYYKRLSNKRTRKNWNLSSGCSYKKNGLMYDISDYKWLYHKESDYWYNDWRTGYYNMIPYNKRYKLRIK